MDFGLEGGVLQQPLNSEVLVKHKESVTIFMYI